MVIVAGLHPCSLNTVDIEFYNLPVEFGLVCFTVVGYYSIIVWEVLTYLRALERLFEG